MPEVSQALRRGPYTLWFAVAGGIVLWLVHLGGVAALTPVACGGSTWSLHLLGVATAIPTAWGTWTGWRFWRARRTESLAFVGALGAYASGFSLLLILAEWAPIFVLDACVA